MPSGVKATPHIPSSAVLPKEICLARSGASAGAGGSYALDSTTGQAAAGGAIHGDSYAKTIGFWNFDALAPTIANALICGRVATADGRGIRNARLVLTDAFGQSREAQTGSFGYFRFEDVPVGQTYILTARAKRFTFSQPSQVISFER